MNDKEYIITLVAVWTVCGIGIIACLFLVILAPSLVEYLRP